MKKFVSLSVAFAVGVVLALQIHAQPPNIVFILADDMGYGDVQAYNPERGKIPTPHMNRLAAEGMMFTDAHSTSSVCTPTRYSILTGRYNWRTRLQKSVLYGFGKPLIAEDRQTVAGFLKQHGYTTACVGKWHLGLEIATTDGEPIEGNNPSNIDWSVPVGGGPVDLGFDYFYGISASLDMPPYLYIENDRFVGEGSATKAFMRKGPAEPDFEAVDVLPEIGRKSVEYIQQQDADAPFFLYVPFTSPHTPILPTPAWKGKSGLTDYGDFTMQTDAVIGDILAAIDAAGIAENTIVIVTSDNGCSKAAKIEDLQAQGHFPSGEFRGSKADLWEGGHRVPMIVRWPAGVAAGTSSDQLISQVDFMATCADLIGQALPTTAGEDSVSFLPALQGQPIESARAGVVHHSISGHFAYRHDKWKLLLAQGSGGWTAPRERDVPEGSLRGQLYDLENDPGETDNLFASRPDMVEKLLGLLSSDIQRGRSTPGPDQPNDVDFDEIQLWKSE